MRLNAPGDQRFGQGGLSTQVQPGTHSGYHRHGNKSSPEAKSRSNKFRSRRQKMGRMKVYSSYSGRLGKHRPGLLCSLRIHTEEKPTSNLLSPIFRRRPNQDILSVHRGQEVYFVVVHRPEILTRMNNIVNKCHSMYPTIVHTFPCCTASANPPAVNWPSSHVPFQI